MNNLHIKLHLYTLKNEEKKTLSTLSYFLSLRYYEAETGTKLEVIMTLNYLRL